jgi:hypothetical protein
MRDMYKQDKRISPLEIYNNIGVTGFSVSTPGLDLIGSYYATKEFFKTQSPKIVMLDTGEFFTIRDFFTELSTRSEIDYMNFSLDKLE